MAETFLNKADIAFEKVYAEENPEITKKFGVTMAPTLVIVNGNDVQKIGNVSNIRKYIETAVQ